MEEHFIIFFKTLESQLITKPIQKMVLDPMLYEKLRQEFFTTYGISLDEHAPGSKNAFRLMGVTIEKGKL